MPVVTKRKTAKWGQGWVTSTNWIQLVWFLVRQDVAGKTGHTVRRSDHSSSIRFLSLSEQEGKPYLEEVEVRCLLEAGH